MSASTRRLFTQSLSGVAGAAALTAQQRVGSSLPKEWFGAKNGYLEVPQKPGLGVELKEGPAELYPPIPEGNWYRPDPDMPPA